MGGGADGQRFRRIRSASRIVFWLGVGAVILFSPASLLFYTDAYQQSGLTLTLPALAAGTAILAIAAYILSFVGDHVQARRELESRLTGGSAHTRPVILLLRSFDGLPLRELTGLFKAMRPLGYAYSSVSRYTLGPAGAARAEKEREFALGGGSYDAEAELDHAIDSRALFVGIGKGHVSCGTAKIVMRDDDRQEMFQRLVEAAFLIFIMPGTSATASELSLILQSRDLQGKAVFIMPGHASARSWALLAEQSAAAGNAKLPNYDANGCYFGLNSEGRPEETAGLKVFTRGLRNYLEANPAALDVTALWRAVEEYQDKNRYLTFMASPPERGGLGSTGGSDRIYRRRRGADRGTGWKRETRDDRQACHHEPRDREGL